ncbi:hypothetical protein [uncultured Streptococcus sp.]|uniref:hypothetical protein n=1 Tax=uncultured Streptococcus sp. TaxID=83427 RepID=UPI002889CE8B|nr:hypothetical protein [uncultured Streptococcus sp.]
MNYFRKLRDRKRKFYHGIFCPAANRSKIQYETKEKADHAVDYDNGGLVRSYYCNDCNCWHTTSKANNPPLSLKKYGLKLFGLDEKE